MDPAVSTTILAEVLKTWGAYGICLLLLGAIAWLQRTTLTAERKKHDDALQAERKKAEDLQTKINALQEARLEDAKQLIRVTDASTQTAASRAQGDTAFLEVIRTLCERVAGVESRMPDFQALPPSNRSPRHQGQR